MGNCEKCNSKLHNIKRDDSCVPVCTSSHCPYYGLLPETIKKEKENEKILDEIITISEPKIAQNPKFITFCNND